MPTPSDIEASLESVLDIYFSDIRHRHRSAYILCDNLVEMACRRKVKETGHVLPPRSSFHQALSAPGVDLASDPLGICVMDHHSRRNKMQHEDPGISVDDQTCTDAICASIEVINRLWNNTLKDSPKLWLNPAIRIVTLYSAKGEPALLVEFEQKMRQEIWRNDNEKRHPKKHEKIVEVGDRRNWTFILKTHYRQVESVLDACGIP